MAGTVNRRALFAPVDMAVNLSGYPDSGLSIPVAD